MDKNVWRVVVNAIRSADRSVPRFGRRPQYTDTQVLKMYFMTVAFDKPMCWACVADHYPGMYRPTRLPSISQFCRRLKTPRIAAMIEHVNRRLAQADRPIALYAVDGKALAISDYSADPDAADGRGTGRFQRGYKLHALVGDDDRIHDFAVHPMNVAEQTVAWEQLLGHIEPGTLTLGDSNFDSCRLYARCDQRGAQMLTPLKGHSRSPARLKRIPVGRRDAMMLWDLCDGIARSLLRHRDRIERVFAALCGAGDGLKGLPTWVRRLHRVRRWVAAKIILYHARLALRPKPT